MMATVRSSTSHEERTAAQPRQAIIEPVIVGKIDEVNPTIRRIRLQSTKPEQPLQVRSFDLILLMSEKARFVVLYNFSHA